jgi:hypothetical protein
MARLKAQFNKSFVWECELVQLIACAKIVFFPVLIAQLRNQTISSPLAADRASEKSHREVYITGSIAGERAGWLWLLLQARGFPSSTWHWGWLLPAPCHPGPDAAALLHHQRRGRLHFSGDARLPRRLGSSFLFSYFFFMRKPYFSLSCRPTGAKC